ncbi:plasmid-related protein [Bacillus sp. 03113]|uniref:PBECR3 domain-containing polyvalent protein n=1 Tax=Bacillus sp. 03113 TaxID=2578211 RepID=UPI001143F560|nr:plasmid-related protein [Bacillus sp. 03113]
MKITINPYTKETQLVGIIPKVIMDHYCIECSSYEVYMLPGFLKHLQRRGHWKDFLKYYEEIPSAIANPDYVGQNPREPGTVELYKVMRNYVLIAIKMNPDKRLFLGSFYTLDSGKEKIKKRLRVGRIHPFSYFIKLHKC